MTAHRHSAYRETGQRGGRKTQEALARLHSARSLNRSQGFTAGCRGSSLAPLGRRSFADDSAEGCRVCNATGEYDGAGCPECSGKGFITNYGQVIHERSEESQ